MLRIFNTILCLGLSLSLHSLCSAVEPFEPADSNKVGRRFLQLLQEQPISLPGESDVTPGFCVLFYATDRYENTVPAGVHVATCEGMGVYSNRPHIYDSPVTLAAKFVWLETGVSESKLAEVMDAGNLKIFTDFLMVGAQQSNTVTGSFQDYVPSAVAKAPPQ